MNLVEQLQQVLVGQKILPSAAEASIALAIGDINRKKSRISRRYLVSRKSEPLLVARFVPNDWPFSHEDITRIYSALANRKTFKIPRLIGAYKTADGMFYLEEYLKAPISLHSLVEKEEVSPDNAFSIMKSVFSELWNIAERPTETIIKHEKRSYRQYLSAFVRTGVFGDVVLEYVDKVIDAHTGSLRLSWSSGDIMDRNILRSGNEWYLVDFEYAHRTLFLWKDAFRNVHYSPWAQQFSLRDLFPGLGDFPDDVAKLLSLAWDQHLQAQIVERRAHLPNLESLRRAFWGVFDASLPGMVDKKTSELQSLADERASHLAQLRTETEAQQRDLSEKNARLDQFQKEFLAQQRLSTEQSSQISRLHDIIQELERSAREKAGTIRSLEKASSDAKRQLVQSGSDLTQLRRDLAQRDKIIAIREQEARNLQTEIRRTKAQNAQLRQQLQNRERSISEKDRRLDEQKLEIERIHAVQRVIYSSGGFKLLMAFWRLKDAILSPFTKKKSIPETVAPPLEVIAPAPSHDHISIVGPLPDVPAPADIPEEELPPLPELSESTSEIIPAFTEGPYRDAYFESLDVAQNKARDEYVAFKSEPLALDDAQVRLIAFYLPQFHPIPENDEWWGKGFTEWRNVAKAVPQFEGHYQPRLPGELGFYDLRVPDVQRRQVELAKNYGIHGFCFHYYWFNGRRLLERPLNQFIDDPEIDFPFCICWANENWTRRWDGMESDILLAQVHSEESDIAFIRDAAPLLQHKNYIRIKGRPVLIVYRVQLMPNPSETAGRWRQYCQEAGIGDPYLVAAQSFGFIDPTAVGFDAAVEFPPHNVAFEEITNTVKLFNPDFSGRVSSYPDMVEKMLQYNRDKSFTVFKTVSPDWDNEARKPGRGHVYAHSTPALYRKWLDGSCRFVQRNAHIDERLVFINAWNEWAEGAHLEPDARYGYAYLEATRQVVRKYAVRPPKVSVVLPNYNREAFIERRLESIIHQTRRPDEIIFLDDASTDKSLLIAEQMLQRSGIKYRIVVNEKNSASVFRQWLKGIDLAEGDLIWMAESDDDADLMFLENLLPSFEREDVLLAYGDISYINADGSANNGLADYYDGLSGEWWKTSHVRTSHELFSGDFAVKNIVPNASGALFRKPSFRQEEIARLLEYKFAGDWYFYALVSRGGSIAYVKEAKSYFRLHETSNSRQAFFTDKHINEHRMTLEDLRSEYRISDETVALHVDELSRVLALRGMQQTVAEKRHLVESLAPKNRGVKLKICIASYGFIIGGGEVVPITLANALRGLGHHVTFLVMKDVQPGEPPTLRGRLRKDIPILKWEDCASRFESVVKEFGFDVINSHNVAVEYELFRRRTNVGVPYVASLHGGYETIVNLLIPEFIEYLGRTVNVWLYLADKNIAPLVERGLQSGRFCKTFNAIEAPPTNGSAVQGVRAVLGLPTESTVLVLASRALHQKGWGIAIEVTRRLRAEMEQDIRLVLIGDGEDFQAIKAQAENAPFVHFLGRVENAGAMIRDCNFGVFPTRYSGESFPLFLLECFSAGMPVVTTDVGAIREMMVSETGEPAGVIVSPSEDNSKMASEIAVAFQVLLRDGVKLKAAQSVARKRAEHFGMKRLVESYLELFESLSTRKVE